MYNEMIFYRDYTGISESVPLTRSTDYSELALVFFEVGNIPHVTNY